MSSSRTEIKSQPAVWEHALAHAGELHAILPPAGARVLFFGCGTSAFVARAAAHLREHAGQGESDWAFASELPTHRTYDYVVAITRSGTTTEVLDALGSPQLSAHRVVVTGVVDAVPAGLADTVVDLGFADEESVVQTRFPTTVLVLLRHLLGESQTAVVAEASRALARPLPVAVADYGHFVYLARGWGLGLADEAALKMREAAQAWAESFPAMDYRHGPIAAADRQTLVVALTDLDATLRADIEATGATFASLAEDPVVRLVQCQRLAID
ncbi:MAG: sugar isomerase, partial [Nocardioides sp.]